MKTFLSAVAVVAAVAFVLLMYIGEMAYPMHLGEPTYYHVARVDCLVAACTCAFVSFVSFVSAHF